MLKKIIKKISHFLYAIPFGLRGADDEILGKSSSNSHTKMTIQQKVTSNKLSDALLQGEITQEVEELRYKTYKVAQESQNYNYLGDGIAIQEKKHKISDIFYIKNHIICESVTHELNRINDYSVNRYILKVEYKDTPRFRVEKFCNYIKVDLKKNELSLFFEKNTDVPEVRMFYNELEKNGDTLKSDIFEYPNNMGFTTEDTFYYFSFNDMINSSFRNEDLQYVITYKFLNYTMRDYVNENYSASMDKKYREKKKKDNVANIINTERIRYCNVCGKEMDIYDGDITAKSFGYPICSECLKKLNEIKKE